MWKAGEEKSSDYHGQMNKYNFVKWMQEKLIHNVPPQSVVVMGNLSCHNVEISKSPSSNSKKKKMVEWLEYNNIPFSKCVDPELIIFTKTHRSIKKMHIVDELLLAHGHTTLRIFSISSRRKPYRDDIVHHKKDMSLNIMLHLKLMI